MSPAVPLILSRLGGKQQWFVVLSRWFRPGLSDLQPSWPLAPSFGNEQVNDHKRILHQEEAGQCFGTSPMLWWLSIVDGQNGTAFCGNPVLANRKKEQVMCVRNTARARAERIQKSSILACHSG